MTKTTHALRPSILTILGVAGLAAFAWMATAMAQSSNACSLGAQDQAAALAEFQTMRARYGATVTHAELTLSLEGDEAELTRVLNGIEAREASCCATLQLTRARTATGYDVRIAGEGPMVDIVATILSDAVGR